MKVAGKLIKQHRLRYGFSQQKLAKGICAQATISLIENQNNCPNLDILTKISHRLNMSVKSMVRFSVSSVDVERAILNGKYQQAKRTLLRMSKRKFKYHHQMDRYFCYLGACSVNDKKYSNALYFFNKVLSLDSHVTNNYYRAWSEIGLSYVYLRQKDFRKTLEFAKDAKRDLGNVDNKSSFSIRLFIKLRITLAWLFSQLNWVTVSNLVCFRTVKDLVKVHSMYKLVDIYLQISQNYADLNLHRKSNSALSHAKFFLHVYKEPTSLVTSMLQ